MKKKEIEKLLAVIDNTIDNIFEEGVKEIHEFSEGKIELKLINKFTDYLLYEIGDKNNSCYLIEQIFIEIKCIKNFSLIFDIKGLGDSIKSVFSDYHYILNNIDILLESISKKLDYISLLLTDNLKKYTAILFQLLNNDCIMASIKFTNEQTNK